MTAQPEALRFDPGDGVGAPVTCRTAGVVVRTESGYRSAPRDCAYLYQLAGRHTGSLTLVYGVTAWGGEVGQAPSVGPRRSTFNSTVVVPITVSEFQPVIIG